jgi:4-amino-4-deoxy-L-arabinose transferase-like glycosyltransferase
VKDWLLGNLAAAVLVLPWHLYEWIHHGNLFLREYFLYHVVQRMAGDLGYHTGKPAWFYLNELIQANPFWMIIILAIAAVLIRAIRCRDSDCRLLLVWMAVIFIPISVSAAKLSWYTVPLYAPFALSVAAASEWLIKSTGRKTATAMLVSQQQLRALSGPGMDLRSKS